MKTLHVSLEVKVPYKLTKRKNWILSYCPILDIYSQGSTEKKAKENLGEAILAFFISCFERGTLDKALKECGFKLEKSPTPYKPTEKTISIPIPFTVNPSHQTPRCHA